MTTRRTLALGIAAAGLSVGTPIMVPIESAGFLVGTPKSSSTTAFFRGDEFVLGQIISRRRSRHGMPQPPIVYFWGLAGVTFFGGELLKKIKNKK